MSINKDGSGKTTTTKYNQDGSSNTTVTTAGPGESNPQTTQTHTTLDGITSSTTPPAAEPEPEPEPVTKDDPLPEPQDHSTGGGYPNPDGTDKGPHLMYTSNADAQFSQFLVGSGVFQSGNPYATARSKSRDFGDPPPFNSLISKMVADRVKEAGMTRGL